MMCWGFDARGILPGSPGAPFESCLSLYSILYTLATAALHRP